MQYFVVQCDVTPWYEIDAGRSGKMVRRADQNWTKYRFLIELLHAAILSGKSNLKQILMVKNRHVHNLNILVHVKEQNGKKARKNECILFFFAVQTFTHFLDSSLILHGTEGLNYLALLRPL